MEELLKIIYIQKYIIKYNNVYVVRDDDLSRLLNINVRKIIKKYKIKTYKQYNHYLISKYILVFISIITNKEDKCFYIFKAMQFLKLYNLNNLEKIKIVL